MELCIWSRQSSEPSEAISTAAASPRSASVSCGRGTSPLALHHLHIHNVRQVDISGRNVLLDANRNVRLCDFAGSAIDSIQPEVWPEPGFQYPVDRHNNRGTIPAEIYALGSTIYELVTSQPPYHEETEVRGIAERPTRKGKYPDLAGLPLGDIIAMCWNAHFYFAEAVADSITDVSTSR